MALPSTRNRTRSSSDPILSADINDLDDQIIAHEVAIHAEKETSISAGSAGLLNGVYSSTTTEVTFTSAVGDAIFNVELPVGVKIVSIKAMIFGADTGVKDLLLRQKSSADGLFPPTIASNTSAAAGIQDLEILAINHVIVADEIYSVKFNSSSSSTTDRIAGIIITHILPT